MMSDRWATFDCYGTLIDWERGIEATLRRLFPGADAGGLLERYHEVEARVEEGTGRSYREITAATVREVARVEGLALEEGRERELAQSLPGWTPFPEVPPALAELHRRRWRLAILSNCDRDLVEASAASLGTPMDAIVSVAESGSYKPAHGHWRRFRELTGAGPDRHLHVAVSLFHDIAPAAELGIPAVWIDRPGDVGNRADRERVRPPRAAELPDLSRLPDTLDRLIPAER
jgi:2-haloacid dehalogenase